MAIDYQRALAVARRLIQESGTTVVARRLNKTPADPAKPWRGAAAPASAGGTYDEVSVSATRVPPSSATALGLSIKAIDTLNGAASAVYIAAPPETGEDITTYDEVVSDSKVLRIVHAEELRPADTTLLYFLMVAA